MAEKLEWKVIKYQCPVESREVVEIWAGPMPCIPANIYLRRGRRLWGWAPTTVEAKAYRLLPFFRALGVEGVSFWLESIRRGGNLMLEFRFALQSQMHGVRRERAEPEEDTELFIRELPQVGASRARDIMGEILDLCNSWTQDGEKELVPQPESTRERHQRRRPVAFRISNPDKSMRGEDSFTPAEYESIWTHWMEDGRPTQPIRGELSKPVFEKRRLQWKNQMAWWSRNLMLWALMSTTGMRRWEIPAVMDRDVIYSTDSGWWVHLLNPTDRPAERDRQIVATLGLARLKTGRRQMYVGWEPRFDQAVKLWRSWRPLHVGLTGQADHGMLLTNGYGASLGVGSPLTVHGLHAWFDTTNQSLGPFHGDSFGAREFFLSPHRIRHSLESMFRAKNVPLEIRQAHFGHKRADTTLGYGSVSRTDRKKALDGFHQHIAKGGQ